MRKKIFFGALTLGTAALVGVFVYARTFQFFEEPTETELKVACDYEGFRKIRMSEMSGNATANNSIHIYASECNDDDNLLNEPIFVASASFIKPTDVSFEWKNVDTVIIKYNKNLEIFNKKTHSEKLNTEIVFKYIAE